MYIAKSCKHLSSQVNYCKVLSFHRKRQKFYRELLEDMAGGPFLYLNGKLLRTRLLFEIWQTDASTMSELMLVSFISSLCNKHTGLYTSWELDSETGNFEMRQKRQEGLKTRSYHTFSESDHNVNCKVSTRRVHRKN